MFAKTSDFHVFMSPGLALASSWRCAFHDLHSMFAKTSDFHLFMSPALALAPALALLGPEKRILHAVPRLCTCNRGPRN